MAPLRRFEIRTGSAWAVATGFAYGSLKPVLHPHRPK